MRRISKVLVLSAVLVGCTSTVLEYPSASLIGQAEAAIKLMCEDPSLEDVLGEQCTSQ